ncbi:Tetratricopeptide repeat protein 4 [Triticum urartu]|uniref:Tetratricopeptide repeat protein 4 n=1 Tax=Triticum urartu TaxID=4572 RepID=M7Z7L1_TRIUA|nr:Tetratricopeptide repeat protein 4 [Triticum urartu]
MALLMEPGSEPLTEGEKADLDAIAAIKESAAREYREEGNQFVKKGRKHYPDAVDCYTKAIAQMGALSAPNPDASVLFANRAHVNLLLGNHRRALDDAQQAVRLSPSNLKVEAQQRERDLKRAKVEQAISAAKDLAAAIEKRGLRLGKAAYQELTGVKKPKLDEQGVLHWPVLLLYPEVMSSDFIEDFPETDMFSDHLDLISLESYVILFLIKVLHLCHGMRTTLTQGTLLSCIVRIILYQFYKWQTHAGDGTPFSKSELLKYLLEGTVDSGSLPESLDGEDGEHDTVKGSTAISPSQGKWIKEIRLPFEVQGWELVFAVELPCSSSVHHLWKRPRVLWVYDQERGSWQLSIAVWS